MSIHVTVWTKGWTRHVLVYVNILSEDWTCHVSNGGVPCEATTCTPRGGPYNAPLLTRLFCMIRKRGLK